MSGVDQLRNALAIKQRENDQPVTVRVPHEVIPARPGQHVARDGKPYTITYVGSPS